MGEIHFERKSKMSTFECRKCVFLRVSVEHEVKTPGVAMAKKTKCKRGYLTPPMHLFFSFWKTREMVFFVCTRDSFAASASADSFVLHTRYSGLAREELILQKIFLSVLIARSFVNPQNNLGDTRKRLLAKVTMRVTEL